MSFGAVSKPWHQSPDFALVGYPTRKSSSLQSFNNTASDDDELLEQLNIQDFEIRLRALNRLRSTAANNQWWFKKFSKKLELFKAFANVLSDANWEIQHQCTKFLADTMKDYGNDLEWCMNVVLPSLVSKLASQKITVRRVAVQALCSYGATIESIHSMQKALIQHGLQKDARVAKEILREIPNLFAPEFRSYSWAVLCDGVTRILTTTKDAETVDLILIAMEKLLYLVGQHEFNNFIHNLPAVQRNNYEVLLLERGTRSNAQAKFTDPSTAIRTSPEMLTEGGKQFRHGIIPASVLDQIDNESDWQIRYNGLERLKVIVENMSEAETKRLQPHLFSYINLIGNVLDDLSIKVVVITLEILRVSVTKLKQLLEPHTAHIISVIGKMFGNQKVVVKQLNMMISMELMKHLHPKPVIGPLCNLLQHRNSRVKEEALNIITASMLRYASGEFNLVAMGHVLAPLLADSKRRVRLAAFECLSVLAHSMGYGKLEPLNKSVREVEQSQNVTGLMNAVQAKLAKRQLPKIKYDGLLEYSDFSLITNNDAVNGQNNIQNNADVAWIMSAGVGPGSAMSRSLSPLKFRPQIPPGAPQSNIPSRVLSAGKNRQKLPWESTNRNGSLLSQNDQTVKGIEVQTGSETPVKNVRDRPADSKVPKVVKPVVVQKMPVSRNYPVVSQSPRKVLTKNQGSTVKNTVYSKPPAAGSNQSMVNGRNVVLSPIEKKPQTKIGAISAQSVTVSTKTLIRPESPDIDPNESLNGVKWNAAKKREQQHRQFEKAQSVESVVSVSSEYKHPWDDVPIKTSVKKPTEEYRDPNSIPSPRRSFVAPPPVKNNFRRHSADSDQSPEPIPKIKQIPSKSIVSPRKKSVAIQKTMAVRKSVSHAPPPPPAMKTLKSNSVVAVDANKPYPNPDQALQTALKKLSSEEWEDKVDGLETVKRLAQYNTNVLSSNVHPVVVALNAEAKNLRSSVSKEALACYAHLFRILKKNMDPEVDKICQVLVAKTGDASNAFIREEALKALECMVDFVTPSKALCGFATIGASHKNAVIRGACAQLVQRIVENLGSASVLASQREFVEKIMLTSLQFSTDNQPQPRQYGKNTLAMLAQDRDFDRIISKTLNGSDQDKIRNIVGNSKIKSGSVAATSTKVGAVNRSGSIRRKPKLPDDAADSVLAAEKEMGSNNWEERFKGVHRFSKLCESYSSYIGNNVKMLETYMQRLNDINGKVALQALDNLPTVLTKIQPHVADALRPVSTEMVKNLTAQLPSKNEDIRSAAEKCFNASIKTLDNSALIQPISISIKTGNVKQKPPLIHHLGKICQNLYSSKQKLVQMHAPPVLNDLLKSQMGDSDVKQATVDFAKVLSKVMGKYNLLDQSCFGPKEKALLETIL